MGVCASAELPVLLRSNNTHLDANLTLGGFKRLPALAG